MDQPLRPLRFKCLCDLLQVESIILSDQNSKGSFFSADVTGVARTLNSSGVGFVLFQTSLGRFVLPKRIACSPPKTFKAASLSTPAQWTS